MNLRGVRIRLTIVYGVITALTVAALTWYAASTAGDRIYESAEREASDNVVLATIDPESSPDNIWRVHVVEDWADPIGEVSVEPPLFTIADRAGGGETYERFEQDGTWLAYALAFDDDSYVISAVYLEDYESDVSALQWRIWLAALTAIAAAAAAGWFVAGKSLDPARRAAQQQRDFIADAAHELRTPLAVIQASASHALSRDRDADAYKESLSEIRQATERAGAGVGELLELARLEAGQAQPRTAPLRLDLLIEEVAAGIRVNDTKVEAHPTISVVADADYGLLRQVLESLVRNAAVRADSVMLTATSHAGRAIIDVIDDGDGFDEELLPHVFDRFRRGDTKGSSGLGMAIAKTVVEAHKGTVTASNRDEGGAQVRIELPLSS